MNMSHQALGKLCYALVNYPEAPHLPVILGLFRSPDAAVHEYAQNHELVRVEGRGNLRFICGLKKPAVWAIHQIAMDMVHSCGVLNKTYAVRLEHDGEYKVGQILHDHEPRAKKPDGSDDGDVPFAKPQSLHR